MTLEEKKRLVAGFLMRCNQYADAKIAEYRLALDGRSGRSELDLKDKISQWTAYRAFNEHAIAELGTVALDEWFADLPPEGR